MPQDNTSQLGPRDDSETPPSTEGRRNESPEFVARKKELAASIDTIARDLGRGMSGNDVLILQNALLLLGYMTAMPNGNFGPKTEDALARFKLANGLATDGNKESTKRFGTNTKRKMKELLLIDILQNPSISTPVRTPTIARAKSPDEDPAEEVEVAKVKKKIVKQQRTTRQNVFVSLLKGAAKGLAVAAIGIGGGLWVAEEIRPGSRDAFNRLFLSLLHDGIDISPEHDHAPPPNPNPNPNPYPFPNIPPPAKPPQENNTKPPETTDQKVEKLLGNHELRKKLEESSVILETGAKKGADGKMYVSSCTGFIIDTQTILTARHCLQDQETGRIQSLDVIIGLQDGAQLNRKVKQLWPVPGHDTVRIKTDGNADFGLIRFKKPYFRKSRALDIADAPPVPGEVYAMMGHPLGNPWKMEAATFGALVRSRNGRIGSDGVRWSYEMLGETYGGNSGGPITNAKGEVIGVVTASTKQFSDQKTYVVPIDRAYVQSVIGEQAPRPKVEKSKMAGK